MGLGLSVCVKRLNFSVGGGWSSLSQLEEKFLDQGEGLSLKYRGKENGGVLPEHRMQRPF